MHTVSQHTMYAFDNAQRRNLVRVTAHGASSAQHRATIIIIFRLFCRFMANEPDDGAAIISVCVCVCEHTPPRMRATTAGNLVYYHPAFGSITPSQVTSAFGPGQMPNKVSTDLYMVNGHQRRFFFYYFV